MRVLLLEEDNKERGVEGVDVCEVSWQLWWQKSLCGVNAREEREKRACGEFLLGPCVGQMRRGMELRRGLMRR